MKCYMPGCTNEATSSSGLCAECLQRSWQDHMRSHAGEIPADCVEQWDHKPDQVWYWSTEGLWRLADGDPRELPDFAGFERPVAPRRSTTRQKVAEDLVAIVAAQRQIIAELERDKDLLEQIIMQERTATRSLVYAN